MLGTVLMILGLLRLPRAHHSATVYSVSPSPSLALCTPAPKIVIFQQTSLQQGNKFLTMTFGCSEIFFYLQTKQDFFSPKQPLSLLFY